MKVKTVKTVLFWMTILHLIMTVVNALLFSYTGLGSNFLSLGLLVFGGFGYSGKLWHLILSLILFLGGLVLLICSYWGVFKRKSYRVFSFVLILDLIISTVWMVLSRSFHITIFALAVGFCALYHYFKKATEPTSEEAQATE